MSRNSVILLSGGLDSVVAGALSLVTAKPIMALTLDYGQKSFQPEKNAAAYFARLWGCPHQVVEIQWLGELSKNSITDRTQPLPKPDLDDMQEVERSAKAAWIPARNLLMVAVAAAHAESLNADLVVAGWNAEEAISFPDNSAGFAAALDRALQHGCKRPLKLYLPLLNLNKYEIVKAAVKLNIDIERTYSCWGVGPEPCGECESCLRIIRARLGAL